MIKKNVMKPGDVVAIIENGAIKEGIFKKKSNFQTDQAIVDFNGTLRKVLLKDLTKIENNDVEKENDTIEKEDDRKENPEQKLKPEITISLTDYEVKTSEIIGKILGDMGISGGKYIPVVSLIMGAIVTELFINEDM